MQKKIYFENSRENKLCGILTTPEAREYDPLVIMVHGFGGSKDGELYLALENRLTPFGLPSLRFDTTGRGESGGDFADTTIHTYVDDVKAAIEYAKHIGYNYHALVGSSVGGLAVIHAAEPDDSTKLIVLDSPVCDLTKTIERLYSDILDDFLKSGGGDFQHPEHDAMYVKKGIYTQAEGMDAYPIASKLIGVPTYIVHGDQDTGIPLEEVIRLQKSIGESAKLRIVKGADHGFDKQNGDFDRTTASMAAFILNHRKQTKN